MLAELSEQPVYAESGIATAEDQKTRAGAIPTKRGLAEGGGQDGHIAPPQSPPEEMTSRGRCTPDQTKPQRRVLQALHRRAGRYWPRR